MRLSQDFYTEKPGKMYVPISVWTVSDRSDTGIRKLNNYTN